MPKQPRPWTRHTAAGAIALATLLAGCATQSPIPAHKVPAAPPKAAKPTSSATTP